MSNRRKGRESMIPHKCAVSEWFIGLSSRLATDLFYGGRERRVAERRSGQGLRAGDGAIWRGSTCGPHFGYWAKPSRWDDTYPTEAKPEPQVSTSAARPVTECHVEQPCLICKAIQEQRARNVPPAPTPSPRRLSEAASLLYKDWQFRERVAKALLPFAQTVNWRLVPGISGHLADPLDPQAVNEWLASHLAIQSPAIVEALTTALGLSSPTETKP